MDSIKWIQTKDNIVVAFPLPSGATAAQIEVQATPTTLTVGLRGKGPLFHHALAEHINPRRSGWRLRVARLLVQLSKLTAGTWPSWSGNSDAPPGPRRLVRAFADYVATDPLELSLHDGDVIHVLQENGSGWWRGECSGHAGLLPSNYVEDCPLTEARLLEPADDIADDPALQPSADSTSPLPIPAAGLAPAVANTPPGLASRPQPPTPGSPKVARAGASLRDGAPALAASAVAAARAATLVAKPAAGPPPGTASAAVSPLSTLLANAPKPPAAAPSPAPSPKIRPQPPPAASGSAVARGPGNTARAKSPAPDDVPLEAPASSTSAPASPPLPAPPPGAKLRAKYRFQGQERGELSFHQNDVLTLLRRDDSGWWQATVTYTGWFPASYVEEIE